MSIADEIDRETNALIKDCEQHLKHCQMQRIPAELAKEVWMMRQMGAFIVMLKRIDRTLNQMLQPGEVHHEDTNISQPNPPPDSAL